MSENVNFCAICKVPATQFCAECKNVFYCTREHQKKHWKIHRNQCAAYRIVTSDALGQHIIATRNIRENEVIMKETPIVVGPKYQTFVTCLGCNKRIQDTPGNIYRCSQCNWPVCGKKCQNSSLHKDECKLMMEKNFRAEFLYSENETFDCYSIIAPLRCLFLKNSSKYKVIKSFKSHVNERLKSSDFEKIKTTVVPFVQEVLELDVPTDEILEVASIFETNSFEIVREDGDVIVLGLYGTASLLKQSCVANTKYSFHGNNFQLVLMSTTPISKGDILTTSHTEVLWGTLSRKAFLQENKFIECSCKRCSDPTELTTYLGAIFCSKCKKMDEEDSPKIVSTDPLKSSAIWKCEKCDHTIPGKQMVWGNDTIKSEITRYNKMNPIHLEEFLVKYKELLHAKNYHALVVKYALVQMYGNIPGYELADLTEDIIERKIDLCHELLEVVDILSPGHSKIRGTLLYDLQATMVGQIKREFNEGKITKQAAQESLAQCVALLREATEILSAEPEMKEFLQQKLEVLIKELDF